MEGEITRKCKNCGEKIGNERKQYCSDECGKTAWTLNNIDKVRKQKRRYYENNKEIVIERARMNAAKYIEKKRKQSIEYSRRKRAENPEKYNSNARSFYYRNRKKMNAGSNQRSALKTMFGTINVDINIKKMVALNRLAVMLFYGIIGIDEFNLLKKRIESGNTLDVYKVNLRKYMNSIHSFGK